MQNILNISPLLRAIGVMGAVAVLVTGATFAALSDNATLTANNISSDTADLQVSNGGAYADSQTGFDASDIAPGVGETFDFYLKNSSSFDMAVTVEVTGVCSDYISGTLGIPNCGDVLLTFDDEVAGGETTYTLQQLINAPKELPGNPFSAGAAGSAAVAGTEGNFTLHMDLKASDITGSSAALDAPFDLVFSGEQIITE